MAEVPSDLRYTAEHEWAKVISGNTVRVGITDYAQNSLGDIVFVSVHSMNDAVAVGDTFGEVESTKSVSDLYAPLAGQVVNRNEQLDDNPELVNTDPYGEGWIAELEVEDLGTLDSLLDAASYQQITSD